VLAIERRREILTRLMADGKVIVAELARDFGVTEETIRRDLERMDKEGLVSKTYGGAVPKQNSGLDLPYNVREGVNVTEKKEIAEKAIKLISPKSCIFIDSGSTTLHFAKELPNQSYYVVTNALNVATEVLRKSLPTVALLGGDVNRNNLVTIGRSSLDFLKTINIEVAIMTATGFTPEKGCFTCGSQDEMEIKRAVIEGASKVIMLLDSSKVDKITPFTFSKLDKINYLVVDKNFPSALKAKIESMGITVV
jgi:DeoR/GlpR family transcriptional regulator of sugar metabolism